MIALAWIVEEAVAILATAGSTASGIIAAVNERWWLAVLLDFLIRRLSKGTLRLPTDLGDAGDQAFEYIRGRVSGMSDAQLRGWVTAAFGSPEGRAAVNQVEPEILNEIRTFSPGKRAHIYKHLISEDIPKSTPINEWVQRACAITGLTPVDLLSFRHRFTHPSAGSNL